MQQRGSGFAIKGGAVVSGSFQAFHQGYLLDARTIDAELSARIAVLPKVSIDHRGMHADGLPNLLHLVEQGVKVKTTGFGRASLDPAETIKAIVAVDSTALMVGTDLPATRARRPFEDADFNLIRDALGEAQVTDVFWKTRWSFTCVKPATLPFPNTPQVLHL